MRVDLSSVEQESLLARAEQAEAAIARVLELCEQQAFPLNDVPTMAVTVTQILHALDNGGAP